MAPPPDDAPAPSSPSPYAAQHRGDAAAYAAYFAGMDASMQQKVAYTTAHFPTRGVVADMGSGSGLGTYQLARLHPHLELVGVDINPVSVARSREAHRLPNLRFLEGDVGAPIFPPGSLDGILDSSVFHHLTSFNGFDAGRVRAALAAQVEQLKVGGVVVVRDFVVGRGPPVVLLDLPEGDGAEEGPVPALSTAALFLRFAAGFRSSVNPDWPVPHARVPGAPPGFRRFKLARRLAAEFLLRKDYREDWDAELLEEYTYFTQGEFEEAFRRLGLRILVSQEVHNPWIVAHRFEGRVAWSDPSGARLPFPPTNFVIVGEKVGRRGGVHLREAAQWRAQAPRFLALATFEHAASGARMELVRRPHETVDLLPWLEREGRLTVVARQAFPRPVVNARTGSVGPHAVSVSGHIAEPVTAVASRGASEAEVLALLRERVGAEGPVELGPELRFFPSPGGVSERVRARLVRLTDFTARPTPNTTPFASAGTLREVEPHQVLRAGQVGGLFDARLELLVYRLLLARGERLQPWIGAEARLETADGAAPPADAVGPALRPGATGAGWRRVEAPPAFLEVRAGEFVEESAEGEALGVARLEYVVPRTRSVHTASVLPAYRAAGGEVVVGLEHRDLPAVGEHGPCSLLAACPAWRLPAGVEEDAGRVEAWLRERLAEDFGVEARGLWPLGGRYFPTAGVTPEVVYPHLCAVRPGARGGRDLTWVPLAALLAEADAVQDGHLLVALFRAAHALGVWPVR
jgi:hypothetical protein